MDVFELHIVIKTTYLKCLVFKNIINKKGRKFFRLISFIFICIKIVQQIIIKRYLLIKKYCLPLNRSKQLFYGCIRK